MMKSSTTIILCLAAVALLLPSCNKNLKPDLLPGITVQSDTVYVSSEGGEAGFTYTVENPVENETLKAEPQAEWISGVTVGNDAVSFTVSANTETKARTAGIILSYSSAYDTVYVRQEAAEITYTDLGEYANCYIVPTEGHWFFNTGKVNGGQIDGIASVDWLWATSPVSDSESQDILTNIEYRDGAVYFTSTGQRGNLVLAALDASGNIVWSWHIWAAETPGSHIYPNGVEFMDRFIGAYGTEPGSTDAYGMLYQWGRKDPFYGGTMNEATDNIAFATAEAETIVNEKLGRSWKFIGEGADASRGISEPMTMFCAPSSNWILDPAETKWAEQKTDTDPCPAGWRVPSSEDFSDIVNAEFDVVKNGLSLDGDGFTAWYPAQGCREDITGVLVLINSMMCWTSTEQIREDVIDPSKIYYFSERVVSSPYLTTMNNSPGNRAMAQPIRCIKE